MWEKNSKRFLQDRAKIHIYSYSGGDEEECIHAWERLRGEKNTPHERVLQYTTPLHLDTCPFFAKQHEFTV